MSHALDLPAGQPLSFDREALVDVSAAIATRREASLARALRIAARVASPAAVDEVLLQAHLFVGFPVALEALILWRRVHPEHQPASAGEAPELWEPRGEIVCRTIYAANYEKLRVNVERLHPDFDRWMATGGYGRVIGRPGLDLATRELCIVALLAVWDSPRQLHSHLRGALHAGASPGETQAAVEIACRHLGPERRGEVVRLAATVLGSARSANGASA